MSTAYYDVAADFGNYAAKVVRDNQVYVIRNLAVRYDGSEDDLRTGDVAGLSNDGKGGATESVRFTWRDQQWVVGEAAYDIKLNTHEKASYARYGTEEWLALVAASFVRLYPKRSGHLGLTCSLPFQIFKDKRHKEVREYLVGTWVIWYEDRKLEFTLEPDDLQLVPEGFGSLPYLCVSESGKRLTNDELASGRVAIIDIGGYNIGITTFDKLSLGAYNRTFTDVAMLSVRDRVHEDIKTRYRRGDIKDGRILEEVISTGWYRHQGAYEDVTDLVNAALQEPVDLISDAWNRQLVGGADIDYVIITGGGGPIIAPLLIPQLDHRNAIVIPRGESQTASALGSLYFRRFKREVVRAKAANGV